MFNIEPFIHRQFSDYKYYGTPVTDISICCPFCDDGKYHMNVSLNKEAVHCFKCSYSANYVKFVHDVTGFPYHRILGELYSPPSLSQFGKVAEIIESSQAGFPEDFIQLTDNDDTTDCVYAKRYLSRRGFGPKYWKRYNLGVSSKHPGRIIIPIEGDYYQARAIFSWMEPKYTNPKSPARDVIFNAPALHLYSEVVVCEGAFSAMAVGNNGIALIGKEPTDEKCERLIKSSVERFIIALEPGAYGSMGVLMQRLYRTGKTVIVWKYSVGDPADPLGKFEVMNFDVKGRITLELQV